MNFIEAIKSVITQWMTFSGRASRSEFWFWNLFYYLVLVFPIGLLGTEYLFFDLLGWVILIVFYLPHLSVTCRRLHDIGRSGWLQIPYPIMFILGLILLLLGPYIPQGVLDFFVIFGLGWYIGVGFWTVYFVVLLVKDTENIPNKYGSVPEHKQNQIRAVVEHVVRETVYQTESTARCVQCSGRLDYGQNFCHICGAKQSMFCKFCGVVFTEITAYCGNCGERINNS